MIDVSNQRNKLAWALWAFKRIGATALVAVMTMGAAAWVGKWQPLDKDGMHDPAGPGIKILQQPAEALSNLPLNPVGNQVDWVAALEQGLIDPRSSILPGTKIEVLDGDVIMPETGEMPMVRFPHRQHTEWLACNNCHEKMFKSKAGATQGVNMFAILNGEYCGKCHGAVAFPPTECNRCHSQLRQVSTGRAP